MPNLGTKLRKALAITLVAMTGGCVGLCAGMTTFSPPPATKGTFPLPHQIPKYPDGISLRFAMVHDVLHERFARHGPAYYRERNRRVREALDTIGAQPPAPGQPRQQYFDL